MTAAWWWGSRSGCREDGITGHVPRCSWSGAILWWTTAAKTKEEKESR